MKKNKWRKKINKLDSINKNKTNNQKKLWMVISSIFGLTTILGFILFGVFYNKWFSLHQSVQHLYGNKHIHIISKTLDGKEEIDKIYTTTKNEETLGDLLYDHPETFKMNGNKLDSFGRMIITVGQKTAQYNSGSWWATTSPTYVKHYEKSQNKGKSVGELNVGVDGVNLFLDETIIFVEKRS